MKSKSKKIAINSLLLGVGLILHQIEPAIFGVKPDMTLIMLFSIMLLNKKDYKTCLICGIITGIFSAMTTTFPGGQIPNLIDKFITVNIMYMVMRIMYKIKRNDYFVCPILMIIGTMVSGYAFLYAAQLIVGLPGGMSLHALFTAVVIPAVIINMIVGSVVFKVVKAVYKKMG